MGPNLKKFMSIIMKGSIKTVLWELALKALVHIGSYVHKFNESKKAMCYRGFVVEKIVGLLSLNDI